MDSATSSIEVKHLTIHEGIRLCDSASAQTLRHAVISPFASCPHKITSYPCLRAGAARGKFYARRSLPAFSFTIKPSKIYVTMPKKRTIYYCNNRGVGSLLRDAKSGAFVEPGREEDRRVFVEEHLDDCRSCRDEMTDHVNQLALSEIAEESGVDVERVIEQLGETAKQLRDFATDRDIPFEEVVIGILHGRSFVTTNSKRIRAVSSVASPEV